jgi:uracil-DNA glycosylase
MIESIPCDWQEALSDRLRSVDLDALDRFVAGERRQPEVYPPVGKEFEALRLTPFASVRAVILGQDPYHEQGQAHGLAFSTLATKRPLSLQNILKEWHEDCGCEMPEDGSLEAWARHGVLLLNTALTVRGGRANSHARAWQPFTSAIVDAVAAKPERVAFLLWGAAAIRKGRSIDRKRHVVIESSHPSPLSANRPCGDAPAFLGSRPFNSANKGLVQRIDWSLRTARPHES